MDAPNQMVRSGVNQVCTKIALTFNKVFKSRRRGNYYCFFFSDGSSFESEKFTDGYLKFVHVNHLQ